MVCRVLPVPSLQGSPSATMTGKPPERLWCARGSSAVVRGAIPPALAGSHQSAYGSCAEAKPKLPPSAGSSAAMREGRGAWSHMSHLESVIERGTRLLFFRSIEI